MDNTLKPDAASAFSFVAPLAQQVALLEGINALAAAWMKRRQEALETGLVALQQISACQDPAAAARICADWVGGSLDRLAADARDLREHTLRMMDAGQKAVSGQAAATLAAVGEQARAGAAQIEATAETTLRRAA
jgi:hypothetical protein